LDTGSIAGFAAIAITICNFFYPPPILPLRPAANILHPNSESGPLAFKAWQRDEFAGCRVGAAHLKRATGPARQQVEALPE